MSCPFYAHVFHNLPNITAGPPGKPIVIERSPEWALIPNRGSNQCALITDAHSPCAMEVHYQTPPDWSQCLRNPERNGTGPDIFFQLQIT